MKWKKWLWIILIILGSIIVLSIAAAIWVWLVPILLLLALVGILVWIMRKRNKKKKSKTNEEYEKVLNDFNLAEDMHQQMLKGGGTNEGINPYSILWEIAKSKRREFEKEGRGIGAGKKLPELPELPPRRDSIQRYSPEAVADNKSEPYSYQRRNRKSLFRRRTER